MRSLTCRACATSIAFIAGLGVVGVAGAADTTIAEPGATVAPIPSMSMPAAVDSSQVAPQGVDPPRIVEDIGPALDIDSLEQYRGGDGGEQTVDIHGRVTGNTADHVVSGMNSISDGAFGNASGINTVIQNSGSNVLIQNGMVVNVQFVGSGR